MSQVELGIRVCRFRLPGRLFFPLADTLRSFWSPVGKRRRTPAPKGLAFRLGNPGSWKGLVAGMGAGAVERARLESVCTS